ncbi:MAG: MFS transporter [Candidatus Cryosericum sp.]
MEHQERRQLTGFRAFLVVWSGQVLSMTGSSMSQFALSIWAYQKTGLATSLAIVEFFFQGAMIAATPLAGVYVDRWNRKLTMMLSDLLAVCATIGILLLYRSGQLAIWHLCVAGVINGVGQAFQFPAYSAAITQMVPKEHYARAGGLMSLAESGSTILAPIFAGLLIGIIKVGGILTIDIVTFGFAFGALLLIGVPSPVREQKQRESMARQMTFGFRYIASRRPLLYLLTVYAVTNFVMSTGFPLLTPMILARTGNDARALAMVQSAAGIGGVLGGLLMGIWGGPRRRILGILLGNTLNFGIMGLTIALGRSPVWWAGGFVVGQCLGGIVNGLSQSIWQVKVPPEYQGRVFASRRLIASIITPVALLISGPLADKVFEPAMASGGWLARVAGRLTGVGPGTGMTLIIFLGCMLAMLTSITGLTIPSIRHLETLIPDNDTTPAPEPSATA